MIKKLLLTILTLSTLTGVSIAEEWGNTHLSYIREVYNTISIRDFQLGGKESIRDHDGHGVSLGYLLLNKGVQMISLDAGTSHTRYNGTVHGGANFSFQPQTGSGFESLSGSSNITYEFDLDFVNPFISLNYTNWHITRISIESRLFLPSTYGVGVVYQKAQGSVLIKSESGVKIAEAEYESGLRRFFQFGWGFNYEFGFFSIMFRNMLLPTLKVLNCNETAVGKTACERIYAATGNRNQSQIITGGVLTTGILF
ncbi:MAG: hypothetical protein OEY59_02255 [Deltaproteobacteria bacterium]|nr:hypothetical protein [Deltaproteobacteria bacterium]